jgi:hypothetical protein
VPILGVIDSSKAKPSNWSLAYNYPSTNSGSVYGQKIFSQFSNGDIAVAGYYTSSQGQFVSRIAADGTVVWNTAVGAGTSLSFEGGMVVDSNNDVFVVGRSSNSVIEIFKLNSSGVIQIQRRLSHTTGSASISGLFTDNTNIYMIGTSPSFGNANYDQFIYSYGNASLTHNGGRWARQPATAGSLFGGPGIVGSSLLYSIPAEGASNLSGKVSGAQVLVWSQASIPAFQYTITVDMATGGTLWQNQDIATDGTSMFLIGYSQTSPKKMVLVKSALGTTTIDYQYLYTCSIGDLEIKHCITHGGYVYFSGQLDSLSPNQQIWGRINASTGVLDLARRINNQQWSGLQSTGIRVDNDYVYLAGGTNDSANYSRPSVWRFKNDGSGTTTTPFTFAGNTNVTYTDITSTFTRATSSFTMAQNNSFTNGSTTNFSTSIPTYSTSAGLTWTKGSF